ncbi:unnamed protein product [Alternaria alternata]
MSTTRRVNHFFKRILKGRQERTKDGKSAAHSSDLTETLCANCSDIDLFAILKGDHKGIPLESGYEVWITRSSDPTTIWIWDEQPGCEFCEFVSAAELHLLPKDASKRWIGRGWTLQEGYFSRRRLFFTDKQVLFDCERGVISEDLQLSQIQYVRPLQRAKPGLVEEDIQSLIEDYTRRVLTHSDDILNAFDGILADLEQNEPPIRSYWGIVMKSDSSGYLDGLLIGLCWFHPVQNEKIYRRLGFPSWSWAGWSYNPCVYYKLRRQADTKLVIAPSLAIRVEKQCGLFEAWKTFEEASPASTQRHDYSQRIHISAPSLKVRLLKGFSRMAYHGREIRGHCGWVVRSEEDEDDYWSERTYLDTSLENLESSPDTYKSKETRTCHAIYLFSADRMRSARDFSLVHNIFSMLLVSKVGTNWERVGLWQQSFESDQEAQVFDQWLKSSPTYKTRDFWIA